MKKLFILDVDGTTLDTIETITYYVNRTLIQAKLEPVTSSEIAQLMGYSSRYLIEHAMALRGFEVTDEKIDEAMDYYHACYQSDVTYMTKAYEGILEMIEEIKAGGHVVVALSNKPDHTLQIIFDKMDLNKDFDFVLGQKDELPKKPDPAMVYDIMERFGIARESTWFIGDTEVDFETAENASVNFIGVSYGFRSKEQMQALNPEYLFDDVASMRDFIIEEVI